MNNTAVFLVLTPSVASKCKTSFLQRHPLLFTKCKFPSSHRKRRRSKTTPLKPMWRFTPGAEWSRVRRLPEAIKHEPLEKNAGVCCLTLSCVCTAVFLFLHTSILRETVETRHLAIVVRNGWAAAQDALLAKPVLCEFDPRTARGWCHIAAPIHPYRHVTAGSVISIPIKTPQTVRTGVFLTSSCYVVASHCMSTWANRSLGALLLDLVQPSSVLGTRLAIQWLMHEEEITENPRQTRDTHVAIWGKYKRWRHWKLKASVRKAFSWKTTKMKWSIWMLLIFISDRLSYCHQTVSKATQRRQKSRPPADCYPWLPRIMVPWAAAVTGSAAGDTEWAISMTTEETLSGCWGPTRQFPPVVS